MHTPSRLTGWVGLFRGGVMYMFLRTIGTGCMLMLASEHAKVEEAPMSNHLQLARQPAGYIMQRHATCTQRHMLDTALEKFTINTKLPDGVRGS